MMRAADFATHATQKECDHCQRRLPVADFYESRLSSDGRHNLCKECSRERSRVRRVGGDVSPFAAPTPAEKECASCGLLKPWSDFGRDRSQPDNLHARCRACVQSEGRSVTLNPYDPDGPRANHGPAAEYVVVADLLLRGYEVFRSCGINSKADVVIRDPVTGAMSAVEVKCGHIYNGVRRKPQCKLDYVFDVLAGVYADGIQYFPSPPPVVRGGVVDRAHTPPATPGMGKGPTTSAKSPSASDRTRGENTDWMTCPTCNVTGHLVVRQCKTWCGSCKSLISTCADL